ncbi:alkaline phosphatase D family protein [Spirillospora sp. CA-294931]|uniref:alkaline phosphatase D family protein n=1 Tax=Spirillospora sp. CA-294931 TaxID=3240042 RepID=UPI003D8A1F6A
MEDPELRAGALHYARHTRRRFLALSGAAMTLAMTTRVADAGTRTAPVTRTPDYPFALGIASGEPLADGVLLWTRLAPRPLDPRAGMDDRRHRVAWEVAEDEGFRRVVRRGEAVAAPEYAHSVHADVRGLRPGRDYFYRFRAGGELSPVGRTRTAPDPRARLERMTFAFASCQAWQDGYFPGYRHMTDENLDLVVHLGDYLYEGGIPANGGVRNTAIHDGLRFRCDTLDRYRLQFALYKSDPDLQAAHAHAPWLVTWDDHEVINNYAGSVADESTDSVAAFLVWRANAYRAFWENQPLRRPQEPVGPDMRLYRRVAYGDLVEFDVLDGRQYRSDQACGDGSKVDCAARLDPARTMLGFDQEKWLIDGLAASKARWKVLANQVVIAQDDFDTNPDTQTFSMDFWDGYKASRDRLFKGIADRNVNDVVVITGDAHRAQAADLKLNFDDPSSRTIGSEFLGTSISSGGDGSPVGGLPPGGTDPANPHIRFQNNQRGYVSCTLTPKEYRADYRVTPVVSRPGSPVETKARFVIESGRPGLRVEGTR